jgi:hypothetical protein
MRMLSGGERLKHLEDALLRGRGNAGAVVSNAKDAVPIDVLDMYVDATRGQVMVFDSVA